MIISIVTFKLLTPLSLEAARDRFQETAPKYQDIDGLIQKSYFLSEDREFAGGIYFWESREHAEQMFDDEWKKFAIEKYGVEPSLEYFYNPVTLDNTRKTIISSSSFFHSSVP